MEQPKMGAGKLLRSKAFWVGDYDWRALCMVRFSSFSLSDLKLRGAIRARWQSHAHLPSVAARSRSSDAKLLLCR